MKTTRARAIFRKCMVGFVFAGLVLGGTRPHVFCERVYACSLDGKTRLQQAFSLSSLPLQAINAIMGERASSPENGPLPDKKNERTQDPSSLYSAPQAQKSAVLRLKSSSIPGGADRAPREAPQLFPAVPSGPEPPPGARGLIVLSPARVSFPALPRSGLSDGRDAPSFAITHRYPARQDRVFLWSGEPC